MKIFCAFFLLLSIFPLSGHAQENAWRYSETNLQPGERVHMSGEECQKILETSESLDDGDPFEPFNRGVYTFNSIVDYFFLERISAMYKGVVPECIRSRVGYVLRNLSEPIVFANNILQGEVSDAEDTLRRFILNSTVGLGGIFDVSTDYGIPYKKKDFGMTLASWGVDTGPYLVLPILGPSNLRDTMGRVGDYALDPINWFAYMGGSAVYSSGRTGTQILDAKTDALEVSQDLKKNTVDPYAASRAWYMEYRKKLVSKDKGDQQALDTPRPDDDEN